MATISNNDIASAIYLELKGKDSNELDHSMKKVVKFLSRKKLLFKSEGILAHLEKIVNKEEGRIVASVYSAEPLGDSTKGNLASALKKKHNVQKVLLKETIDSTLLGGIKVEVGEEVIDLTVSNKIKKLQEYLTRSV